MTIDFLKGYDAATSVNKEMQKLVRDIIRYRQLLMMRKALMKEVMETPGMPEKYTMDELEEVLVELILLNKT